MISKKAKKKGTCDTKKKKPYFFFLRTRDGSSESRCVTLGCARSSTGYSSLTISNITVGNNRKIIASSAYTRPSNVPTSFITSGRQSPSVSGGTHRDARGGGRGVELAVSRSSVGDDFERNVSFFFEKEKKKWRTWKRGANVACASTSCGPSGVSARS